MYWIGKSRCIIYKKITITHKKIKKQKEKTTSCSPIQTASNIFFCYKKGFMYKTGNEHKIHSDPNVISSKALQTHFFCCCKTRTINQVIKRLYKQYKTFYSLKNHSNILIVKNIINTVYNPPPVDSLLYKY